MKMKYIYLFFILSIICQCKKAENNDFDEKVVNEKILIRDQDVSNNIIFKVTDVTKKVSDSLDISPLSKIDIVVNDKEYEISKVPGEGGIIEKSDFIKNNVPATAISACNSWWAGSGDWFYAIKQENKVIVYKGWDGEGNEDNKGKNWEIAKEIKLK
jgi:hypothetical protein